MEHKCHTDIELRLKTIEGHIRAVIKMLEDDKYCIDIATQLLAIEQAVKKTNIALLKNHLNNCIKDASASPQDVMQKIDEYNKILEKII